MTGKRVLVLIVGVAVGAAAVWVQNWWTFAAMAMLVLGVLREVWQARNANRPRVKPVDDRVADAREQSRE